MEKFFKPNRFFLFFCLALVLVWFSLQMVIHMHLTNMAKIDGERIYCWSWPSKNIRSTGQIYETKILSRGKDDAVIKVLAKQIILFNNVNGFGQKNTTSICEATLTYYRANNNWFLGKVVLE